MPLTTCPECRHVMAAKSEQFGHRIRCPNCEHSFRPARRPFSIRRAMRPGQPAEAVAAILLMLIGGLGIWVAAPTAGPKGFVWQAVLDVAVVGAAAGVLLLLRHAHAVTCRPQPVSSHRPGTRMGTPGFEPGTRRL